MGDNTTISPGAGGDSIRDVQRTTGGPKTQVIFLDIGAQGASGEKLLGPAAHHDASVSGTFAAAALLGFALRETSGSASAVVKIHDGTTSGGALLVSISLSPGESARDWFGLAGIAASSGNLYVEVVSGAVEGSVFA